MTRVVVLTDMVKRAYEEEIYRGYEEQTSVLKDRLQVSIYQMAGSTKMWKVEYKKAESADVRGSGY